MSLIQVRRGTDASASSNNPVLAAGEIGYDTGPTNGGRFKIGDGTTQWSSLPWAALTPTSTDTVTNKTMSGASNTFSAIPESAVVNLGADLAARQQILIPTAVKTSAYTAAVGDLVPVDTTSASVTVTLPNAPADKSRIAIMKVDSTANTLTISRGGTTDVFEKSGGAVSILLPSTRFAFGVILQYLSSAGVWYITDGYSNGSTGGGGGAGSTTNIGSFASLPAAGNVGNLYFCTDAGLVLRDNGTTWDVANAGVLGAFAPPPSTGWSTVNLGTATVGASLDGRLFTDPSVGSSDNWRLEVRTLSPASSYTHALYLEPALYTETNFAYAGIILRDSASGNLISYGWAWDGTSHMQLQSKKWNSPTSSNLVYAFQTVTDLARLPNWLRVRDDAVSRYYEYSYNGVDWILHYSSSRTDFIAPNQIGWGVNNNGTGQTAFCRLRSYS